ncbi:hypothetical protein VC83_00768 [Pseudogymnoascus destructans]|uniref:EDC4-like protein pdc1 beta-propeller domain-containing protein n=2 Tax=Pseudogymnoascus destructans TaxID=655981 RepID=L8G9S9_PSED2|nr:uncharacterized protein VC83_00768 [Pseudogymnoascus destructans]ELR08796.1 hypothetical protein GMDG_03472 [Pseudogymnoascus destructans 20631-21]OAF62680.1 hypothetical protein VC83_00768 [Pseudogymnoascus destructans]
MAGYSNNPSGFDSPECGGMESLIAQLRQRNAGSGSTPTPQAPGSSFLTQIASQQLASQSNPYYAQPQASHLHGYHHPSVSSAMPTPPIYHNQPPHHSSGVMRPVSETGPSRPMAILNNASASNADRTANLLNLLKFSQPAASSPENAMPISPPPVSLHQTQPAADNRGTADLLATLMGSVGNQENKRIPSAPQTQFTREPTFASEIPDTPADTQAYLLQLLNRPKPAQSDNKPVITPAKVKRSFGENTATEKVAPKDVIDTTKATKDVFTDEVSPTTQPQVAQEPIKNTKTLFNYVNPFEQLAASSPRNRTPVPTATAQQATAKAPVQILKPPRHTTGETLDQKRKEHDQSPSVPSPAHAKRKLGSTETVPTAPGPSDVQKVFGIGSTKQPTETVAQALNEAGNQADKEVSEALARAVSSAAESLGPDDSVAAKAAAAADDSVDKLASLIEKQDFLKDGSTKSQDSLKSTAVKSVVSNTVQDSVVDSWESVDADSVTLNPADQKDSGKNIKIYNFPLKPWVAITLQSDSKVDRPTFDPESAMAIARLRKVFDQNDRTLVTATNNFIVFAMSKNGGIRIIRQDSGRDRKIFDETRDQVFNISASTSNRDGSEAVIGTGCSGTVYWAAVKDTGGDKIEEFNAKTSFALPPIQSPGDENPGGVLKTRARKSSVHPEFFAVGRGKSIHIIFPYLITGGGFIQPGPDRFVDIEKYLSQRTPKIDTGKAAKDFTFSQDDTTVVSLDKAGRVKFWDVRGLTSENQPKNQSIETKEPLMTLITTPATEKSWPTSVIFVDKVRPYLKGCALRYLIVGMKQNHTLQLWDLALGKPVQELHLPHDKESDAACSVVYHAATGVIVVGHPTRNSIYFIHVSAPKYNLPKSLSQSEFIEKLVKKDTTLPSPESTAVMSGIREYLFSESLETKEGSDKRARGDLRSLDILQPTATLNPAKPDTTLFELYAMHSTGVTCISVKPETLGWDSNNRAVNPASAVDEGLITVSELKPIESPAPREPSVSSVSTATTSSAPVTPKVLTMAKETGRKAAAVNNHAEQPAAVPGTPAKKAEQVQNLTNGGQETSGTEKVEKKKKKKAAAAAARQLDAVSESSSAASKVIANGTSDAVVGVVSQDQINKALKMVDASISDMARQLNSSIDKIYQSFDTDKTAQAAAAEEKQVALLRLVSSTLGENVDKTLGSIVETNTKKILLPSITDSVSKAVSKNVHDHLSAKLGVLVQASVSKELQAVLPGTLGKALEKPDFLRNLSRSMTDSISSTLAVSLTESISSAVVQKVAFKVEENFAKVMKNEIVPSINALAARSAQKSVVDIQRTVSDRINNLERQRQSDSEEISKLSKVIEGLTEMISTMASAQEGFQAAVLRGSNSAPQSNIEQTTESQRSIPEAAVTSRSQGSPVSNLEQFDSDSQLYEQSLQSIGHLMSDGEFETAMMTWIKLNNGQVMQDIFDNYFSKYDPGFMREVSPILSLSTAATISQRFDSPSLMERIQWLETILQIYQSFAPEEIDPDVVKPCATLMELLKDRFEHLFMRVSQASAHDPLLKRLHTLVTVTTRIMENMQRNF